MTAVHHAARGRLPRCWAGALLALIAIFTAGCDLNELLTVDPLDRIPAEALLADPKNAELVVNGAIGDFDCAFGAYVALGSVMAGEMTDATPTAARWPYDRRNVIPSDAQYGTSGCTGLGIYVPLSTARWSADNVLAQLQKWTDDQLTRPAGSPLSAAQYRQTLIAKAAAYAGYSYLLLGEAFCNVAIDLSAARTPADIFALAVERFSTALTAATAAGNAELQHLARLGRARAYLNLGQGSNAATDADAVLAASPNFVYNVTASSSTSRRHNRVFAQNGMGSTGGTALSVGDDFRTVTHAGMTDPRVAVHDAKMNNSDGTPRFIQQKYGSLATPLPLATADEARLIIAEVRGGAAAQTQINFFHTRAGLPTVDLSAASAAEIRDHVREERRIELWLESHRFNDIERWGLTLTPAPGTPHRKGGTYGSTVCFPIPDVETRNNPHL